MLFFIKIYYVEFYVLKKRKRASIVITTSISANDLFKNLFETEKRNFIYLINYGGKAFS